MSMKELYQRKSTPQPTMNTHKSNPLKKPKNNCLLKKKKKTPAKQTQNQKEILPMKPMTKLILNTKRLNKLHLKMNKHQIRSKIHKKSTNQQNQREKNKKLMSKNKRALLKNLQNHKSSSKKSKEK